MNTNFEKEHIGSFEMSESDKKLHKYAKRYHDECEMFDYSHCTGPIRKDGSRLPRDAKELGVIWANAQKVRENLIKEAVTDGFTKNDIDRAIKVYRRNIQC